MYMHMHVSTCSLWFCKVSTITDTPYRWHHYCCWWFGHLPNSQGCWSIQVRVQSLVIIISTTLVYMYVCHVVSTMMPVYVCVPLSLHAQGVQENTRCINNWFGWKVSLSVRAWVGWEGDVYGLSTSESMTRSTFSGCCWWLRLTLEWSQWTWWSVVSRPSLVYLHNPWSNPLCFWCTWEGLDRGYSI